MEEIPKMMKKLTLLVVFAMVIGTTPIYAASANNTTTTTNSTLNQQIQGKEQQLSQGVKNEINSLRDQIKSLRNFRALANLENSFSPPAFQILNQVIPSWIFYIDGSDFTIVKKI